jgi:hypothetical protein
VINHVETLRCQIEALAQFVLETAHFPEKVREIRYALIDAHDLLLMHELELLGTPIGDLSVPMNGGGDAA